jgi:ABC-type lipoprotein export system ATPase subunit
VSGKRGSGKSTLLKCLVGDESIDSGEIILFDKNLQNLSDDEVNKLKKGNISYIDHLPDTIDCLSIKENIEIGANGPKSKIQPKMDKLIEELNIDYVSKSWKELTYMQMQIISIARFILSDTKLIIADEPTVYFNSKEVERFVQLIKKISSKYSISFVIATEESSLSSIARRGINLIKS